MGLGRGEHTKDESHGECGETGEDNSRQGECKEDEDGCATGGILACVDVMDGVRTRRGRWGRG